MKDTIILKVEKLEELIEAFEHMRTCNLVYFAINPTKEDKKTAQKSVDYYNSIYNGLIDSAMDPIELIGLNLCITELQGQIESLKKENNAFRLALEDIRDDYIPEAGRHSSDKANNALTPYN